MVQNQGERKLQQAAFKWSKHECTESPPLRAVIGSANGAYLGGGIRGAISWAILKSTGASAGYPDFFIHRRGHNGEIGLAIEFKVGDNDLTPDQKWWREELLAEGNEYKVVRSLAGFKKELHEYLHGPPPPPQRTVTGHDLPSASAFWEYTSTRCSSSSANLLPGWERSTGAQWSLALANADANARALANALAPGDTQDMPLDVD